MNDILVSCMTDCYMTTFLLLDCLSRVYVTPLPLATAGEGALLRLIRVLKLFPSIGTNVIKHYNTVGVHRSFPQGVVP